ncbi:nucleotide exchange factor GrpE [Microbacterium protaetiae]|uniref:Protein GrpE n=1 Tax=Microbacterium protaetiae TaxID=2509458 RepID=A0A4P6ECR0_9MICO|nr:nucleotide exchange factor GrpE [Microbacterium protaetiae]QAY59426.1 nucleotide exchange factor GrpE [Microbacterium protaetiae]
MTEKDFDDNDEVRPDAEGSEAHASDPDAQDGTDNPTGAASAEGSDDEWTVDDILGTAQNPDAAAEDAKLADLESTLLNDLKRLQAEYANYRRRTEEQRQVEIDRAKGEAAKGLLPVLDDLDRAEKHGDLEEGSAFALIAEKVRGTVERLGVTSYGAAGEAFDPQHHEAVFQQPTPGTTEPTVLEVVETGYRLGDVELRPAKVVVAVPAD